MVDVCLEKGSGFVEYQWEKPQADGSTELHPKMCYVEYFKPWDWIVGTGVYIDDIEAEANRRIEAVIGELAEGLSKVKISETGYIFIVDDAQKIVIHPDMARGTDVGDTINQLTGKRLFNEIVQAAHTPEKCLNYLWPGPEGGSLSLKKAYVLHFKPLDWYICSSVFDEEIKMPSRNLTTKIFFFSGLMLLIALLLSVLYSRSIIRPLKRLSLSVKDIETKGIGNADIPVGGTMETKNLGNVLKDMLGTLTKSERLLRESEEKYRILFDKSVDAVFILDDGHYTDCNPAALDMFKAPSRNQIIGKAPYELSPERQADGSQFGEGGERVGGKNLAFR